MLNRKFLLIALRYYLIIWGSIFAQQPTNTDQHNNSLVKAEQDSVETSIIDLLNQHTHDEALSYLKKLENQYHFDAKLHFALGNILSKFGKPNEAFTYYHKAITNNPEYIKNFLDQEKLFQQTETKEHIIKLLASLLLSNTPQQQLILTLLNNYKNTIKNNTINSADALKASILLQASVNTHPEKYSDLFCLGLCHIKTQEIESALTTFHLLAPHFPDEPNILYNIAYTLKLLGKMHEAIPFYKQSISLQKSPEKAEFAHYGLAQALLATGNFEQGWQEFEYRLQNTEELIKKLSHHAISLDNLKNKKIFILSEPWGCGDCIQFIRYAELLKKRGAFVIVQTFKSLMKLFARCSFIDLLIPVGQQIPPCDYQIPLLSLPLLFKTTVETIPAPIPYLFADPELITYWKQQLKSDTNFKIGIFWQTSNSYTEEFPTTKRSIPLAAFAPLASLPGVSLYSLQKNRGLEQIKSLPPEFILHTFEGDFDDSHGAFMDTAAIMQNLDLVITADSSMNHLAAALGKEVWVCLPHAAEWRWMQNRTDTPWYPGLMRLFRQPAPGNWHSVIMTVKEELLARLTQEKHHVS